MRLLTLQGAVLAVSTLALAGVPGLARAEDKHDKQQEQQDKHKDQREKKDDHQQAKEQQQQDRQQERQQRGDAQQERQAAQERDRAAQQQAQREQSADQRSQRDQQMRERGQAQQAEAQRAQQQRQAGQQAQIRADQQAQQQARLRADQQAQQQARLRADQQAQQQRVDQQAVRRQRDQRIDDQQAQIQAQRQVNQNDRAQARLSGERQQQLIQLQQARTQAYSVRLDQSQRLADQRAVLLQQQNRMAQYRFQQEYVVRVRQQQSSLSNWRSYDYNSDPYFYTAPSFQYSRAGRTYQTNRYGADLLRQAVNYGYEEGVRAGEADRQDGYRRGYQGSYAYEDANYGYTGMYVDQADYNYYFRQGFQRGYQDGYSTRFRYGRSNNGSFGILGNVLTVILRLQPLR